MTPNCCIDLDCYQQAKGTNAVSGDVFECRKLHNGERVMGVLADGLGSGIEAASLASLTAAMAIQYVSGDIEARRSAEILMDALPVDQVRHISYSTFSLADAWVDGRVCVLDHGNPPFILVRDGQCVPLQGQPIRAERWHRRELGYWQFQARSGDRLILVSDGITQAGMGTDRYPLGWGQERVCDFITTVIRKQPEISTRQLSRRLVARALNLDGDQAGDDMTCVVLHLRQPRCLLMVSGPPYAAELDGDVARRLAQFTGRTVVCGGTTSNIIARELNREVTTDLGNSDPEVPAPSRMEGVDLVTEGMFTLSKVVEYLEKGLPEGATNAAAQLVELLLDSDQIEMVVGTSVNEAHQDPRLPVELDIRRNVIKHIASLLERQYVKQIKLEFV